MVDPPANRQLESPNITKLASTPSNSSIGTLTRNPTISTMSEQAPQPTISAPTQLPAPLIPSPTPSTSSSTIHYHHLHSANGSNANRRNLRSRTNCVQSTAKSLNTLRRILQPSLNEELHNVIEKYVKDFFEPAAKNIEMNQQAGIVPTNGIPPRQCIKSVCKQILDEAKKMY